MKQKRFTEVGVEKLAPPMSGRLELKDFTVPQLRLRVTCTGNRSWSVIYKIEGDDVDPVKRARRLHRLTLGRFPMLSVEDARDAARDALKAAAKGRDPAQERRAEIANNKKDRANTVARLVKDYIRRDAKPNLKKWKEVEGKLNKHLIPKFGDRALVSITRGDAKEWIEDVGCVSGPGAAEEMLRRAKRVYNWALEVDIVAVNPFDRVKLPKQFRQKARERILSDDEIKSIWAAAEKMGYPYGPMYQLLLLTGQRREEIGGMRWAWLSDDLLEIPSDSYKTQKVQVVPLSELAKEIVGTLPTFKKGDYVFTTSAGKKPISGYSKGKLRLDELSEVTDWVVHDMRRTVRTNMPRLGISKDVARKVIGHSDGGVDAIYDRYDYFKEKKTALETWSQYVMKVIGRVDDNVIELREVSNG